MAEENTSGQNEVNTTNNPESGSPYRERPHADLAEVESSDGLAQRLQADAYTAEQSTFSNEIGSTQSQEHQRHQRDEHGKNDHEYQHDKNDHQHDKQHDKQPLDNRYEIPRVTSPFLPVPDQQSHPRRRSLDPTQGLPSQTQPLGEDITPDPQHPHRTLHGEALNSPLTLQHSSDTSVPDQQYIPSISYDEIPKVLNATNKQLKDQRQSTTEEPHYGIPVDQMGLPQHQYYTQENENGGFEDFEIDQGAPADEAHFESDAKDPVDEEGSDDEDDGSNFPEMNNKRVILQRFTIYNSLTTMYIVGSNAKESLFRILEIGKDSNDPNNLVIIEDKSYFYTRKDMIELINGLNESNEGGIHKIAQGYGLLGLIKFTKGYYLSIITKCSQVAILGGHFLYHVDETKLIPLDFNYKRPDKYSDEERLLSIFKYLDLGKTFYFSYAYDITNTLQTNFIRHKKLATEYQNQNTPDYYKGNAAESSNPQLSENFNTFEHNERFVWNNLLLRPLLESPHIATYEWFQPIIHGFIDQANISIFGKKIYITIIARRSHHFAGARFLKRGVNDKGNVANEIETEQIVSDMLISSFHDPKYGFFNSPRYTSFVQHRGSIPLYWTQDLNRLPKPPIEINLSDPFYQSSAIHFNNLFQRYGSPIIILNLIKTKEKQPRESKLNQHFSNCITYLNQFLPEKHKLQFNCFDMSKHSKKNLDVITPLQKIAGKSIDQVGFFHNGRDLPSTKIQKGIIRTNCIDCLDRTNAAQFIICKEALSYQLASLGLISESTNLEYDSDLINILTEIFHDHGDTIAVQYGGSNLVNTMDSYRRINQWSSHTRDILNSVKRIYSNSFMDSIRQEAINLFLGNYVYDANKSKLWELQNDFFLHNNSLIHDIRVKISYIHWYNSRFLADQRFDLSSLVLKQYRSDPRLNYEEVKKLEQFPEYNDNWFNECYVPRKYQSLNDLFQFNMNSNARYFPSNVEVGPNKSFDYSPFDSRKPTIKSTKEHEDFDMKTSKSGAQNLKYLDGCADENTYRQEPNDDEDVDEEDFGPSDFEKFDNYSNKHPNHGTTPNSGYSNGVSNSNKIKNFLATKIEMLGYNNKASQEKSSSFHLDSDSYATLPGNFTTSSRLERSDNLYVEGLSHFQPRETDSQLYRIQSDIPTLSSSIQTVDDSSLELYQSSVQLNSVDDAAKGNAAQLWQTVNFKDLDLYSHYLGMDDDKLFNFSTEDDYFK